MVFQRALLAALALSSGALAVGGSCRPRAIGPSCSKDLPFSCQNSTMVEDTCCFMAAGQVLLTQYWDTNPATGPGDSWTIHGLWPDWCDGTYPEYCDKSREYSNISAILKGHGAKSTLAYMETYWKGSDGDDEGFWSHEWDKHGTCISTLERRCYANYKPTAEVVDYFKKTVELFKTLPTYEWLKTNGITPSDSKTYTSDEILKVLEKAHGARATIRCQGQDLREVWYHFNVKGSLQSGKYDAVEPDGAKSNCPVNGVRYNIKK